MYVYIYIVCKCKRKIGQSSELPALIYQREKQSIEGESDDSDAT